MTQKKKSLKIGQTVEQKMIDRDGEEHTIKSKVIGKPGQAKKLDEVNGPQTEAK